MTSESSSAPEPQHPIRVRRSGRRVQTDAPPGYLGEPPAAGDPAERNGRERENDRRLRDDVPPHWG